VTDAPASPLPEPARFCPQCGRPLRENAHGRPACPAEDHDFTWYADPKVATGVVVNDGEGRILLVRRNHEPRMGMWAFPSGFVDAGEVVEEAATREVREETGVEVRLDGLLGVYSEPGGAVIFIAYAGTIVAGTPEAGDEASEVGCFAPDALPPLAFAHDDRIVADWQARFAPDVRAGQAR
jgi:ADP-ribose pyrophosphatase YjhB (NUDIX family)